MAGSAVIGALHAVFGADTVALENGLKRAATKLGFFAGAAAAAGNEFAQALGRGIENVVQAIPKAIDKMDEMGKAAQKIGIPAEELSALKYVADLSGVSFESLTKSVAKLGKTMTESAAKPTSEAANAFRAIGVSARNSDGSLKTTSQVIGEVAGKFEGMKDGAGKTAIAMALFGRAGADLIPLLNAGKTGIAEATIEARKFGLIISTETTKAAEAFNDNLTRLVRVKDGLIITIAARMLPALQALSQRMVDAAKNSDFLNRLSVTLASAFEGLVRVIMLVSDNFGTLIRVVAIFVGAQLASTVIGLGIAFVRFAAAIRLAAIATAALNIVTSLSRTSLLVIAGLVAMATGNFDTLTQKMGELGSKVASMLPSDVSETLKKTLGSLGLDISALTVEFDKLGSAGPKTGKALTDVNIAALGGKNAMDQYLLSVQKNAAAQQAEMQTVGMAAGAKEKLRVILQGLTIAAQNNLPYTEALRAKLQEAGNAAGETALKIQGYQLVQEAMEPHLKFRQELANNEAALRAVGATAETIGRSNEIVAQRFGMTWQQASQAMAGSIGEMGSAIGSFGGEWARAVKIGQAIAAAQALIATFAGAADALKLGFPQNLVVAAAIMAKGLALVAAIRSAVVPSAATGGSFMVKGGMSPTDNHLVAMNLAAGERVDVTPARDAQGGESGSREIVMRGIKPRDLFTGDMVRGMFDAINQGMGDGYRIRMA